MAKKLLLSNTEKSALKTLKKRIARKIDVVDIVLYGSAAYGKTDKDSDIDLLIITKQPLSRERRHEITDEVFEVNLEYDTNFSTLVVDKDSWETGCFSVLPIKEEIIKDGLSV